MRTTHGLSAVRGRLYPQVRNPTDESPRREMLAQRRQRLRRHLDTRAQRALREGLKLPSGARKEGTGLLQRLRRSSARIADSVTWCLDRLQPVPSIGNFAH